MGFHSVVSDRVVEGFTAGGQCPELVGGHPPHGTPAAGDVARGREGFEFALSGGVQVEGLSGFHGVSFAHVTILQQLEASSGPLVPLPPLSHSNYATEALGIDAAERLLKFPVHLLDDMARNMAVPSCVSQNAGF